MPFPGKMDRIIVFGLDVNKYLPVLLTVPILQQIEKKYYKRKEICYGILSRNRRSLAWL